MPEVENQNLEILVTKCKCPSTSTAEVHVFTALPVSGKRSIKTSISVTIFSTVIATHTVK